jgi:hypothetical protein
MEFLETLRPTEQAQGLSALYFRGSARHRLQISRRLIELFSNGADAHNDRRKRLLKDFTRARTNLSDEATARAWSTTLSRCTTRSNCLDELQAFGPMLVERFGAELACGFDRAIQGAAGIRWP